MGSVVGGLFGGSDAGSSAAGQQQLYNDQAIRLLKKRFNQFSKKIEPFIQAGTDALGQVVDASTPEGLDSLLGRIFNTDTFGNLVDERERSVRGQLAAGGMTRSGTAVNEIANIPTSIGLQLENLLTGRQGSLAASGQNAVSGLGSVGQQNANSVAQLLMNTGMAAGSGIITDAQSAAAGGQNLLNLAGSIGSAAINAGGIGSLVSSFFSDPRLKENIEEIGSIKDLNLYSWDWIEGAKGTMIEGCPNIGFMADEVQDKYPDYVVEYCGFKTVNYPALLEILEAA